MQLSRSTALAILASIASLAPAVQGRALRRQDNNNQVIFNVQLMDGVDGSGDATCSATINGCGSPNEGELGSCVSLAQNGGIGVAPDTQCSDPSVANSQLTLSSDGTTVSFQVGGGPCEGITIGGTLDTPFDLSSISFVCNPPQQS